MRQLREITLRDACCIDMCAPMNCIRSLPAACVRPLLIELGADEANVAFEPGVPERSHGLHSVEQLIEITLFQGPRVGLTADLYILLLSEGRDACRYGAARKAAAGDIRSHAVEFA